MKSRYLTAPLLIAGSLMLMSSAHALDAAAAEALAKKEGCLKCHGVTKKKEGDSLTEISAKFKGKADADAKILEHLTSSPKVKMADGSEEEHKMLKTRNKDDIANLIAWLRSLAK